MLKRGTLIDGTIVEAQAGKPSMQAGSGAKSTVDPDADWTRKDGKSHFGYKAHVAVEEGSGLIRRALLTPARTNDGYTRVRYFSLGANLSQLRLLVTTYNIRRAGVLTAPWGLFPAEVGYIRLRLL
jgi:IS5 family transposase